MSVFLNPITLFIVHCGLLLLDVTVVNSVFCSEFGPNGSFGRKIAGAARGGAKTKEAGVLVVAIVGQLWSIICPLPIIMSGNWIKAQVCGAFASVFAGFCTKLGQLKVLETSERLIVQDFFLLFKCLFKDPIVVMLTVLTLTTLLRVNVILCTYSS